MSSKILAELTRRMQAIESRQLQAPNEPVAKNAVIVGIATETIKVLYGTLAQLIDEVAALDAETNALGATIKATLKPTDTRLASTVAAASTPAMLELARQFDDVGDRRHPLKDLLDVAKEVFWSEVKATYPELYRAENVTIYTGWQIGFKTAVEEPGINSIDELLASLGDSNG